MEKEIIKIIAQNIGGHIPDQKECAKQIYQLFETRIKELEGTIENMKAIAINIQQPEQGHTVTSVDYPSDNETEVHKVLAEVFEGRKFYTMTTNCCKFPVNNNENYCPNCGRKIIR